MRESDDLLAQLKAKLAPANIRATLAFAGLFQLTHELIKRSVLDEVKGFYGYTLLRGEPKWLYGPEGQRSYEESVLALAPGSAFRGSLLWLKESDAITSTQVELLDKIYRHRHDLTHELGKYLVDPSFEPDLDLLVEALSILRSISRFWTQIEIDIGTFEDHGAVTVDDVTPTQLVVLQLCVDAYVDGLTQEAHTLG